MFKVKNLFVLNAHPMLNAIACYVAHEFGKDIVTSGFRPGDRGVHGTVMYRVNHAVFIGRLRGVDIRVRNKKLGFAIQDHVNAKWQYDPKRRYKNVAIYHRAKRKDGTLGAWHLHLQVHPNTRRRSLKRTNGRYPV